MDKINYNQNLSLIQTLPTSITQYPPQPHINDPIADSGCTGHYLDSLKTIVHTRDPSENPINVKLPNSSTMASTHQSQIPLKKLSSQAKHAENFLNLHSSLISIGKLCDDECIVTFDKHKLIVSRKKDIIIEDYPDPTNGLLRFPLHHSAQNNKQENILEPHLCNHSRAMAPRHPIAYRPTSQQYLAIFYHQILCCPTKLTLLQEIKDGSFSTWSGLTEKLISKYLPESEITEKGTWTSRKNDQRQQQRQMKHLYPPSQGRTQVKYSSSYLIQPKKIF